MAPRKKTTGIETVDESDAHLAAPHQGIAADDLSPDTLLALDELGASVSAVVIERKNDNGADWDYMARLSAAEYRTEYIKEQFGGGEYRVTIIDEVRGRLNPVRVSVDKRFVGKMFANASPVQSAGVANDPFRDRLLEVLLAKALTPAPAQNNSRETIELVLAVVGAVKGNDGGAGVLDQMKTMFEMSKTMADMSNPPEGIAGVAANYLPVIERIVSSNRPAARVVQRTTPALPAPAPVAPVAQPITQPIAIVTPPNPEPAHVAGSIVPKWLTPFQLYAKQLVKIADRGSDPTMYADLALEEIQDDQDTFVAAVEAMEADRLLTDLFAVCPELEKTDKRKEFAGEFVTAFKAGITEILNTADNDDTAEAGGT